MSEEKKTSKDLGLESIIKFERQKLLQDLLEEARNKADKSFSPESQIAWSMTAKWLKEKL